MNDNQSEGTTYEYMASLIIYLFLIRKFSFRKLNNSQIPFEIYEAAYEEAPEEDRKSFYLNQKTNENFYF